MRTFVFLLVSVQLAHADGADPETARLDKHRVNRMLAIGGAIGLFALSETVVKFGLAPESCRWCNPPGIDTSVRDAVRWNDLRAANDLSNLSGYVAAPLGMSGLILVASAGREDRWVTFVDDLIVIFEANAYSQLLVQAVKFSVGRQRPYARFGTEEPDPSRYDKDLSFLSGHAALTFGIAVSAGQLAHRRGYALEPVIWGVGLGLAASTSYLRIAADKHYFTDVMAGAAVGVLAGIFIPRLTGSLRDAVVVAPTTNGISLTASF